MLTAAAGRRAAAGRKMEAASQQLQQSDPGNQLVTSVPRPEDGNKPEERRRGREIEREETGLWRVNAAGFTGVFPAMADNGGRRPASRRPLPSDL